MNTYKLSYPDVPQLVDDGCINGVYVLNYTVNIDNNVPGSLAKKSVNLISRNIICYLLDSTWITCGMPSVQIYTTQNYPACNCEEVILERLVNVFGLHSFAVLYKVLSWKEAPLVMTLFKYDGWKKFPYYYYNMLITSLKWQKYFYMLA